MFMKYRTPLMNAATADVIPAAPAASSATATAPVVVPAAAAPTTPVAPQLTEDQRKLVADPESFKARLTEAGDAATRKLYKELGVKDADEAKSRLAEFAKLKDAQLTEQERNAKQLAELAPKAQRAEVLESTVREYLRLEEAAVPESKKALLDLAPSADSPEARLKWIAQAKTKGLFNEAAPVAALTQPTPPANTRAGVNPPPPPAPANATKHPREMTPEEFKRYEAQRVAEHTAR